MQSIGLLFTVVVENNITLSYDAVFSFNFKITVFQVLAGEVPKAEENRSNSSLWEIRKGIFALHQDTCHVKVCIQL